MLEQFLEHLTKKQQEKIIKILKAYPEFYVKGELIIRKVDLGKIINSRPDNVIRDLRRMSSRYGYRFRWETLTEDSQGKLYLADAQDERKIKKGGRRAHCSLSSGLEGKSRWLRLFFDTRY